MINKLQEKYNLLLIGSGAGLMKLRYNFGAFNVEHKKMLKTLLNEIEWLDENNFTDEKRAYWINLQARINNFTFTSQGIDIICLQCISETDIKSGVQFDDDLIMQEIAFLQRLAVVFITLLDTDMTANRIEAIHKLTNY